MEIINTKSLDIWYDQKNLILKDINLSLNTGAIYGLLGKNGSGKTTLMNTLCGVLMSFKGSVKIGKKDFCNSSNQRFIHDSKNQRFFIPDFPMILPYMNSIQFITFLLKTYNSSFTEEQILEMSERYNFSQYLYTPMKNLSLGNKKKASIICSIIIDAPILIFDEPLNGLDIQSIDTFLEDLEQLSNNGKCIIISSHLLDIITKITPNIIYITNQKCFQIKLHNNDNIRKVLSDYDQL